MIYPVTEKLKNLSAVFLKKGYKLYLVGGAVRDYLLKKENSDYDFTTNAKPEEIKKLFKHTIDTGLKHGTVTVLFKGESFEITTFRTDGIYLDSRHPENVSFTENLSEDLKRRDFTINALAVDLESGEIIDQNNGTEDLKNRTIRAIGDSEDRFSEDALRMLRAVRFQSKLNFKIEENTFNAIKKLHKKILNVSKERIKEELFLLLSSPFASNGIKSLSETHLLEDILPEVEKTKNVTLKEGSVFDHTLKTLKYGEKKNYPAIVMVALLLHDTGKTVSLSTVPHFISSSITAENVLKRLKCSNEEIATICTIIKEHMISLDNLSEGYIRRTINRVGENNLENFFLLLEADLASKNKELASFEKFKELTLKEVKSNNPRTLKDLKINGNDLLSFTSGKKIGIILNKLLDEVIDSPELNKKEILLKKAKEFIFQDQD